MPVLTETTEVAANITTTYSMDVGDYFFGSLGTTSDSDWIEVTLQAGQIYTFGLVGVGALTDNLSDPYLRLRDSAGTQIDFDDDGGPGRNSGLTFTAATTGTYYLDVQSWNNTEAGDYGLSMVTGSRASYDVTMGAGNLLRPHESWSTAPGTGATVTWAIRASGDDGNGFIAPSAAQVAAIQGIMGFFDGISGLDLTQVSPGGTSNDATMLFGAYNANDGAGAYAYYPGSTAPSSDAGDVWLNNNSVSTGSLPQGSYSYFAVMHEIGHAVGLAHPGDYDVATGDTLTYVKHAQFTEDTHQFTVMSFLDESNTTTSFGSYPDTLMLFDILALHQQYGADMSFHAGNTIYGFNATVGGAYDFTTNTDPVLSIWDGGGTDTLDLSGYGMAQVINLGEGMFSDIGGFSGNVSIAIGAVIENAVGGTGNDMIIGNGVGNRLHGGVGNDTIMGGGGFDTLRGDGGADSIDGGDGIDYLDFTDAPGRVFADIQIDQRGAGFLRFYDVGQPEGDVYANLEDIAGGDYADNLRGNEGANRLWGGGVSDRLYGRAGDDLLLGEAGADAIYGGLGADTMTGGADVGRRDRFIFFAIEESGVGAGNRDVITDFAPGEDRIEISRFDADVALPGRQDFTFIGNAGFSGTAGELGYLQTGGNTIVQADVDGDGVADFEIELSGLLTLSEGDFLL